MREIVLIGRDLGRTYFPCGLELGEALFLRLNVVVLNELLYVDEVGRNLLEGGGKGRVLLRPQNLPVDVVEVVFSVAAVDHTTQVEHRHHVLWQLNRVGPQIGHFLLQTLHGFGHPCSSIRCPKLFFVKFAAHLKPLQIEKTDRSACADLFIVQLHGFGN